MNIGSIETNCPNCGGKLTKESGQFYCPYCGTSFPEENIAEKLEEVKKELVGVVKDVLLEQKLSDIANARKNLYDATHEKHINDNKVLEYSREVKKYLSDDVQANFYEIAVSSNVEAVNRYLDSIDADKYGYLAPDIIEFMLKSLEKNNILALKSFIDRVYRKTNKERFVDYTTRVESEAEKIDNGIYRADMPRDVFVAYSSADIKAVHEVTEYIEKQGLTCFISERNMRHGKGAVENYQTLMETAMKNCKCLVFMSSEHSRNFGCDALNIELRYIKENLPKMGRVEYIVEEYKNTPSAVKTYLKDFFEGLEFCRDKDDLVNRIVNKAVKISKTQGEKYCKACGTKNYSDAKFCCECTGNEFVCTYEEYEEYVKIKTKEAIKRRAQARFTQKNAKEAAKERKAQARFAKKRAKEESRESRALTRITEDSDERKRIILKIVIPLAVIAAIIIAIVVSVISCNAAKRREYDRLYTIDNIEIKVIKKTNDSSWVDLHVHIKNNGTESIRDITGQVNVYEGSSKFLLGFSSGYRGYGSGRPNISSGESVDFAMQCSEYQNSNMKKFHDADLSELQITYTISYVCWIGQDRETLYENKDESIKIIKPYDPQEVADKEHAAQQAKEEKYQNALTLMQQGKYNEAAQTFNELGDYKDSAAKKSEAQNLAQQAIKEEKYQNALSLMRSEKYKEATKIFNELLDYKDSAVKIDEILDLVMNKAQGYADMGEYGLADSLVNDVGHTVDMWHYAGQGQWGKAVENGLTKIVVKEGTTKIAKSTFSGCSELKKIKLPSSLEIIEEYAFQNCYGLTSIVIPSKVYSIGANAFSGCYKLLEVYDLSPDLDIEKQSDNFGKVAYYAKDVFTSSNDQSNIFVDRDGFTFYENNSEAILIDYVGTAKDVTLPTLSSGKQYSIQAYAFYGNDVMHNVVISDCVTKIGDSAFYRCSDISNITIGNGVVTIGQNAFTSSSIESVAMGSILLTVGDSAFLYCSNLSSVTLGENLQTIGESAFGSCGALRRITIPYSVTVIKSYAFQNSGLVYAKFENKEGWTRFSPSELSDPANAAKLLSGFSYCSFAWTRT